MKMFKTERTRWRIRRLIPGALTGNMIDREVATEPPSPSPVVRLLGSPRRKPQDPIQQALIAALRETGSTSLAAVVKRVARDLYRDELHNGAAVLDIGPFGDRLFHGDVIEELRAGNGVFWEIQ